MWMKPTGLKFTNWKTTGTPVAQQNWLVPVTQTGFSHCTPKWFLLNHTMTFRPKIVPVKSHNDFLRPLVKKGVV